MSRTVYLVIFNSPLFPAHWALWIPLTDNQSVGKLLHATGDAAAGFQVAFERNYDLGATTRRHQVLPLAQVSDQYVVDIKGDGSRSQDQIAYDYLEQVTLRIPPPTRSLVSATSLVRDISSCECPLLTMLNAIGKQKPGKYPELPDMATSGGGFTRAEWSNGPIGFTNH